jgi:hypothetical protein
MTAKEMVANVGKVGLLSIAEFGVAVTIVDARLTYGRVQYRVEGDKPNTGSAWVDAARVKVQG